MGLGLIMAIGAQNAFVLRQGIRKKHVGAVVATCVISDAILILAGVAGFGALTQSFPLLVPIARWGGAFFLFFYGILSFRRAFLSDEALSTDGAAEQTARSAIMTCLALTWLNPHVYLDTVVLLGAVAAQYGADRWNFGFGAVFGSLVFFVSLGYGARVLQPFFTRPVAWRILDFAVGIVMWSIALSLVLT